MGELAELLELLHGAGSRWQTVRLVMRQWGDSERSGVAINRHADRRATVGQSRGTMFAVGRTQQGPSTWEINTRAWVDRSGDRIRVETSGDHGDRLTIRAGRLWWAYAPQSGSISNETEPEVGGGNGGDFDWMLEPATLLPAFDFTPAGMREVAGRHAVNAMAFPRRDPRAGFGAHFAHGADDLALAVDAERGVVLRAAARIDDEPFALFEITEIAFDEDFPDDLFCFTSPDGSPVRSPRGVFSQPQSMSVEEAARRASFTVVVPTRLPEGWTLDASYVAPSERPARKDSVLIRVLEERHNGPRIRIQQSSEPVQDRLEWEIVERNGRSISVFANSTPGGAYEAKVQISGTHVRVSGDLEREAFLDIVSSLRPAPTELPPMLGR